MITIGNKDVILNQTFIVPVGQEAWVSSTHGEDSIKMCIVFEDSDGQDEKSTQKKIPSVRVEGKGDHARVTLVHWHAPLGAVSNPMKIGQMNGGKDIFLIVDCVRSPKFAKILLQVMIGGAE